MTTEEKIDALFEDWNWIGLRLQRGAETKTKIGDRLRPSKVWIDGRKMRTKLPGTAAFFFRQSSDFEKTRLAAYEWGYHAEKGERWVLIGSNDNVNGADMPEKNAAAFRNAVLIGIIS